LSRRWTKVRIRSKQAGLTRHAVGDAVAVPHREAAIHLESDGEGRPPRQQRVQVSLLDAPDGASAGTTGRHAARPAGDARTLPDDPLARSTLAED